MSRIRVGVIGARRNAQGIGEHVARHLAALGAQVTAIAGTRAETVAEARGHLLQSYGIEVRGYTDVAAMLAVEELDAVAICSPDAFHRQHLAQALEHRLHVLCEKPLVFEPGRDPLADAGPLVEGFAATGKVLMVNQQWPYTLPQFQDLYPDRSWGQQGAWGKVQRRFSETADTQWPERFAMLLSPSVSGLEMLPNSLPHVFSLLLALAPSGGDVEQIRFEPLGRKIHGTPALILDFSYVHRHGTTDVSVYLRQTLDQPRPAGYAINGQAVERTIELPGYAMFFQTTTEQAWRSGLWEGEAPAEPFSAPVQAARQEPRPPVVNGDTAAPRRVPLPDPLVLLLRDFLGRIIKTPLPAGQDRVGGMENRSAAAPSPRPSPGGRGSQQTPLADPILIDSLRLLHIVYNAARANLEN